MTPAEILCEAAHVADTSEPEVGGVYEAIVRVRVGAPHRMRQGSDLAARIAWGRGQRWPRWSARDRITASLLAAAEMLTQEKEKR